MKVYTVTYSATYRVEAESMEAAEAEAIAMHEDSPEGWWITHSDSDCAGRFETCGVSNCDCDCHYPEPREGCDIDSGQCPKGCPGLCGCECHD